MTSQAIDGPQSLRVAAGAIIALAAGGALWAVLLQAGVQAFPADSYLTLPRYLSRQIEVTLLMGAVAAATAAAVVFVAGRLESRPARWGLWVALGGAALLLLAIGADILSSRDLAGPIPSVDHHDQPMFWYKTVGAMLNAAAACFALGWALVLGAALAAVRRARRVAG
ncbi:MAG: hypothetical protein V4574_21525 [Pseudomonadota bacterium]